MTQEGTQKHELTGKRIAFLFTDGVERSELLEPLQAVREAGADVTLISPKPGEVQMVRHGEPAETITTQLATDAAEPTEFDGLVIPGGVANPDELRTDASAVRFVRAFFDAGKPVGAICHGPWMLAEADVAKGRTITSWPSLRTDLTNAGATWVDRSVSVDEGLVTSRKPDDLPAFNRKMIEEFGEGVHKGERPAVGVAG
jgi:protease I